MRKGILKKSGSIATGLSVLTGIGNIIMSFFGKGVVGSTKSVSNSIPWLQTLLIMLGVFVVVFILIFGYYFVVKRRIEEI